MHRKLYILALAPLLIPASDAEAQGITCAKIDNDTERLACYDAAAKRPASPIPPPKNIEKVQEGWKIVRTRDKLSGKTITHAETKATADFNQRGQSVSAFLIVYCTRLLKGHPDELKARVWFSRPVAVGRTWGRLRIDDRAVQALHPDSSSRGQSIEIFFPQNGGEGMAPLYGSKRLRVEYDLPFAGTVMLEFPTIGAKETFTKLTCEDPEY